MKIFSSEQIREIDAYTIAYEPIASVDLMERASNAISNWILENLSVEKRFVFICGPGNNGGDGLAVARLMYLTGFNVEVFYLDANSYSADFIVNLNRLKKNNVNLTSITGNSNFPSINSDDIIVDALYGSGLSRPIDGLGAELVEHINKSGSFILSIDIPSGLFSNENPVPNSNPVIKSSVCLTLQFPKLSFLFAENEQFVPKWIVLPIGLHNEAIENSISLYYLTEKLDFKNKLFKRSTFSHKGIYGHSLIIAGSYGMMGAAALCSNSAVKSGSGLVTMHVPKCGYSIVQQLVPMAMCKVDEDEHFFTTISDIEKYSALCIGPGLGTNEKSVNGFAELLSCVKVPFLVDADALNIISLNKQLLESLPINTIITPHPGEFDRLFGKSSSVYERMIKGIEVAKKYNLIVVIKGAYTQVICPDGEVHFNSTGNSGMATGGSGDVLSGVICGLLAQGYSPANAATIGVYVHGLAGDIAKNNNGEASLNAYNIIESLPLAFKCLEL
jgi:NAD(P)H-hydrate epimerase